MIAGLDRRLPLPVLTTCIIGRGSSPDPGRFEPGSGGVRRPHGSPPPPLAPRRAPGAHLSVPLDLWLENFAKFSTGFVVLSEVAVIVTAATDGGITVKKSMGGKGGKGGGGKGGKGMGGKGC